MDGTSIREFARRVGVGESAVRQAIKAGRLDGAVHEDGSLDFEPAHVLWLKTTNPRGPKPKAERDKEERQRISVEEAARKRGINDAKLDKLEVDLELSRHELARIKRESIPYGEARRALAGFMRTYRDVALQFAVRHGPAIAAEVGCDEGELIAAISSHMRTALNEAADNPRPFPRVKAFVVDTPDREDGELEAADE